MKRANNNKLTVPVIRDVLTFSSFTLVYIFRCILRGEMIFFKHCLYLIAAGLLAAPISLTCKAVERSEKPNVLFINIDDLRAVDHYDPQVKTPNLDRLANKGIRFVRAFAQASFSNPSRTSFLTGLRPSTTEVVDNRMLFREKLPEVVTLPQLFRESGYQTIRIGKIFHGSCEYDDPRAWDMVIDPKGTFLGQQGKGRNLTDGEVRWCRWRAAKGAAIDQADGQIAREAIQFLEDDHQEPFFLAVGFHKPHDPFVAPEKYFDMYPLKDIQLHQDPPDRSPTPPEHISEDHQWKKEFNKFTENDKKEFLRSYYACATFMDAQFGKVLRTLEETGQDKNTIVVLISDHGYHLGERGWWNKTTLYEYTARTPMIVYTPDMKAKGKVCSRLVEFVDIYPTLTDLCGLKPPHKMAGRSFRPLLDNPEQPWKEAAYTEILHRDDRTGRTVRTEHWRYIEWRSKSNDEIISQELFDHRQDPGEYYNLADDPKYRDVLTRMEELLKNYISSVRSKSWE